MALLLTPTPAPSDCPQVVVHAALQGNRLSLSYHIRTKSPYDWAVFNPHNCRHQDFLWENDCLECFISIDEHAYFEVNASPNGAFALYRFDDYRTPKQLPPPATQAPTFTWQALTINQPITNSSPNDAHAFQSQFHCVIHLPDTCTPVKLNPTVILHPDGEPIFYAHTHATPPDFHDKAFWVDFDAHAL